MSNSKKSVLYVISRTIRYAIQVAPWAMAATFCIAILHSLFQASSIILYKMFFDKVQAGISGEASFANILLFIGLVSLAEIGILIFHGIYNLFCQDFLGKKLHGYIRYKMNLKAEKIDLIKFEESALFDNINKALNSIESSVSSCLSIVGILTYYIPFFLVLLFYFMSLQPKLTLILLATFLPVIISNFLKTKIHIANEEKVANIRRKINYYNSCITSRQYFKETRLLGAFSFFYDLYKMSISLYNKAQMRAQYKVFGLDFSTRVVRLMGYIGTFVLLFYSMVYGEISVAALGAIFISIEKLNGITDELVSSIGESYKQAALARFFYEFMDTPERKGKNDHLNKANDIRLDNVSFRYPMADKNSLENINLNIRKGETIALVGENGAGKTTLAKLIMGLYAPSEGKIYIGDKDLSEYSYSSLNNSISSVFQNYQRYQITLKDNISISDISIEDDARAVEVARKVGVPIDKMPDGMDTLLSREFNGIDLSGGEWQRIAISRGIFRDHNLIVLDEPTAAIDPLEENKLYNVFFHLVKGKTAVLVTHRLGSVRIADRIIVMDNGKIVEDGTHEELLDKQGLYATMWKAQKEWYER